MHVDDETLSALLDDQLPPTEAAAARRHLDACEACQQRYLALQRVVQLVRLLPQVEPPRSFTIGPRTLEPTLRVRRLAAWYDWSRAVTSALAAIFVLLLGARLYLGSTPPLLTRLATAPSTGQAQRSGPAASQAATAALPGAAPQPRVAASGTGATPPNEGAQAGAARAPGAAAPQGGAVPQAARVAPPAASQSGAAASVPAAPPAARPVSSPAPLSDSAASVSAQPAPAPAASLVEGPGWLAASLVVLLIAIGSTLLARHRLRQATSAWHHHP